MNEAGQPPSHPSDDRVAGHRFDARFDYRVYLDGQLVSGSGIRYRRSRRQDERVLPVEEMERRST